MSIRNNKLLEIQRYIFWIDQDIENDENKECLKELKYEFPSYEIEAFISMKSYKSFLKKNIENYEFKFIYYIVSGKLADEFFENYNESKEHSKIMAATIVYCENENYYSSKPYANDPYLNPGGITTNFNEVLKYIRSENDILWHDLINKKNNNIDLLEEITNYGNTFQYAQSLKDIALPIIVTEIIKKNLIENIDIINFMNYIFSKYSDYPKIISLVKPSLEKYIDIPLKKRALFLLRLYTLQSPFYGNITKELTNIGGFGSYKVFILILYYSIQNKIVESYCNGKLYRRTLMSKYEMEKIIKSFENKKENTQKINEMEEIIKSFENIKNIKEMEKIIKSYENKKPNIKEMEENIKSFENIKEMEEIIQSFENIKNIKEKEEIIKSFENIENKKEMEEIIKSFENKKPNIKEMEEITKRMKIKNGNTEEMEEIIKSIENIKVNIENIKEMEEILKSIENIKANIKEKEEVIKIMENKKENIKNIMEIEEMVGGFENKKFIKEMEEIIKSIETKKENIKNIKEMEEIIKNFGNIRVNIKYIKEMEVIIKSIENIKTNIKNIKEISSILYYSKPFMSFSKNKSTVRNFAKNKSDNTVRITFILNPPKHSGERYYSNIDIEKLKISEYDESEVLFLPLSCFEIESYKETGEEEYEITLNYLDKYYHQLKNKISEMKEQKQIEIFYENILDSPFSQKLVECLIDKETIKNNITDFLRDNSSNQQIDLNCNQIIPQLPQENVVSQFSENCSMKGIPSGYSNGRQLNELYSSEPVTVQLQKNEYYGKVWELKYANRDKALIRRPNSGIGENIIVKKYDENGNPGYYDEAFQPISEEIHIENTNTRDVLISSKDFDLSDLKKMCLLKNGFAFSNMFGGAIGYNLANIDKLINASNKDKAIILGSTFGIPAGIYLLSNYVKAALIPFISVGILGGFYIYELVSDIKSRTLTRKETAISILKNTTTMAVNVGTGLASFYAGLQIGVSLGIYTGPGVILIGLGSGIVGGLVGGLCGRLINSTKMRLKCKSFYKNYIPHKFREEGNIPEFYWKGVSKKAKSFVLETIIDQNPNKKTWCVINIPRQAREIKKGIGETLIEYKNISNYNPTTVDYMLYSINKEEITEGEWNDQDKYKKLIIDVAILEVNNF